MEDLIDLLYRALPIVQDAAEYDPHLSEHGRKQVVKLAREIEKTLREAENGKDQ